MEEIKLVSGHQYCSPVAISITSSGRETVRPAASGGRESRQSRHRMQRDGARGGHRRTSSDAARDAAAWCTATAPGEGFEFGKGGKGGKHLRNRAQRILQRDGLSPEPMSWRGCAVPYRCLNTRCRIFPVAVRGISSSWMNV